MIAHHRTESLHCVADPDEQADAGVKDEGFLVLRVVAEGDEICEVVENSPENQVATDPLPIETFCFGIQVNPVEARDDQEGDKRGALQKFIDSVGANFAAKSPETIGRQSFWFLWLKGEDVGLDLHPLPLEVVEVPFA